MDSWDRFNETLPDKKSFYSKLYLKVITTHMLKKHLKNLIYKISVITTIFMFKVIYYCLQMYLKASKTSLLKYMSMTLLIFCLHLD